MAYCSTLLNSVLRFQKTQTTASFYNDRCYKFYLDAGSHFFSTKSLFIRPNVILNTYIAITIGTTQLIKMNQPQTFSVGGFMSCSQHLHAALLSRQKHDLDNGSTSRQLCLKETVTCHRLRCTLPAVFFLKKAYLIVSPTVSTGCAASICYRTQILDCCLYFYYLI